MSYISVEVDIDVEDFLEDVDTDVLVKELESRKDNKSMLSTNTDMDRDDFVYFLKGFQKAIEEQDKSEIRYRFDKMLSYLEIRI